MLANTMVPHIKYDPATKGLINTDTRDYRRMLFERAQSREMTKFKLDLAGALKDIETLKQQMKQVLECHSRCQSLSQTL